MSIFTKLAQQIFASVDETGAPRTISEQEVVVWGTEVERVTSLFVSSGGLIYSSKAEIDADLDHGSKSLAWVLGDPVVANNGVYGKVGPSGSGTWTRRGDLPFSFIAASNSGLGTPNAIRAVSAVPVSSSSMVYVNVIAPNTSAPVTISFNDLPPLTLKTNSGNDIVPGGLVAGSILLGFVSGSSFRLLNDQASSAVVAAAEGWANVAQAAANSNLAFITRAAASAANISASIHSLTIKGDAAEGDGKGGLFVDVNNGNSDTFTSVGGRIWYRATDVSLSRLGKNARGLRSSVPLCLKVAGRNSNVRYITRSKTTVGRQTQGSAWDEVNRFWYEMRVANPSGYSQISRYRMDGPIGQLSLDSQNEAAAFGHQSIAVQNFENGNMKLWVTSATSGRALRFTYVPAGDPASVEDFVLFDAANGEVTLCVSWDQQYLVAQASNLLRVFRLSDLATAGDFRGSALYEWTIPASPTVSPLQGLCSDGEFVYVGCSKSSTSDKIELRTFDLRTGEMLDQNMSVAIGLADAQTSGIPANGGLTFYELESINLVKFQDGKRPQLVLNTIGGDDARRRTLYHILDLRDQVYAADRTDALLRGMDPFAPNAMRRQAIREFFSEYARYGLLDGVFGMWVLAAHAVGADLINWIDPGTNDLIRFGTGTGFNANVGFAGNGTDIYLGLPLAYMNLVNYERDRAHIAVAVSAPVAGSGPIVGVESGAYTRMDARTTGGDITSRMNGTAALDTATGAGLTMPGIISMDRNADDGLSYALWKGDTRIKTVNMILDTGNSTGHLVRFGKADVNYLSADTRLHIAELRRPLTDTQIQSRNRIWKNYMSELGTTLTL